MANSDRSYLEASLHSAKAGGAGAPAVRLNRGLMSRGMSAGRGGASASGGGGGGRSRAVGGVGMNAFDRNGDPAVTGEFDQNPRYQGRDFLDTMLGNAVTGGGSLTDNGKNQKGDYDILRKGMALYAQARTQGASDQQAAQHAVASLGAPLVMAMMLHPSAPLSSSTSMHQFLSGDSGARYAPDLKSGRQYQVDQNTGEVLGSKPIPGAPAQMGTPMGKPIADAQGRMFQPMLMPNGQTVAQPIQMGGGAAGGGGIGASPSGTTSNQLVEAPKGAAKMTQSDRAEVRNLAGLMGNLQQAKDTLTAQGGLGETAVQRYASQLIPGIASNNASTYNQAIDALHAGIGGALGNNGSRLKAQYQQMQELLPSKANSEEYARGQLNKVADIARTNIASMAQQFPADQSAQQLAQQYNATPAYWLGQNGQPGMMQKLQALRTSPGSLSNNDIAQIYAFEGFDNGYKGKLDNNSMMSLADQMNRRGLWSLRDQMVQQNPALAQRLPTGAEYNAQFGDQIKARGQTLGQAAVPKAPLPTTPNPQGTQQLPGPQSYNPDVRAAEQKEQADATSAQLQPGQVPSGGTGQPTGNNIGPNDTIRYGKDYAVEDAMRQAGEGIQANAQGTPAAEETATGNGTKANATAPNADRTPQPGYQPTSQADALNYNELQDLRRQGLAPGAPQPAVQWAGAGEGGSPTVPSHPMGRPSGGDAAQRADELQRAMQQKPEPPPSRGGPAESPYTAPPQVDTSKAPMGADLARGAAWSVDPMSVFSGMFGKSEPAPRGEAPIRSAPGYNPERSDQSVSGLGGERAPAEREGTQDMNSEDVTGLGTPQSPVSQQQVIPIPPPQPANASPLSVFDVTSF